MAVLGLDDQIVRQRHCDKSCSVKHKDSRCRFNFNVLRLSFWWPAETIWVIKRRCVSSTVCFPIYVCRDHMYRYIGVRLKGLEGTPSKLLSKWCPFTVPVGVPFLRAKAAGSKGLNSSQRVDTVRHQHKMWGLPYPTFNGAEITATTSAKHSLNGNHHSP